MTELDPWCPECGELYIYHYEFEYTCLNGHQWPKTKEAGNFNDLEG